MTSKNPFKYFKTLPKTIYLAVMYYVRYPLSFSQVDDILHERSIDISHETVRLWAESFGSKFAKEIRQNRVGENWHLPFRRREWTMQLYKTAATLQRLVSYHSQYITTSIMRDIFKTDRLINKTTVTLLLSGSTSALHRFMWSRHFEAC